MKLLNPWQFGAAALAASFTPTVRASESDIHIPDLASVKFFDGALTGHAVLMIGLAVCVAGVIYGWWQYLQTKNLQVHSSMGAVSQIIWETCKTYLWQQGKFLAVLWLLIAACMIYYFGVLSGNTAAHVAIILAASVLGILGSYGVAWFGIRINTVANSRAAFSALKGNPLATLLIPLKSGMSVGLLLVAIELFFMICILAFLPSELAGPCFIGFAIGESLGASA
ncbi:MAG: sodium/proton-translocating pyrophosphatase, partial [Pseudomonadota bacterium]